MSEFLNFLEFCWSNKEDQRFSLTKRLKYGLEFYYISWDLLGGRSISINVDSRNHVIELSLGYDSLILIEDPFIFIELFNRCEVEFNDRLNNSIDLTINSFFNSLETEDKDLSRIWKFNKMEFLK